jgi:hypothetical protein
LLHSSVLGAASQTASWSTLATMPIEPSTANAPPRSGRGCTLAKNSRSAFSSFRSRAVAAVAAVSASHESLNLGRRPPVASKILCRAPSGRARPYPSPIGSYCSSVMTKVGSPFARDPKLGRNARTRSPIRGSGVAQAAGVSAPVCTAPVFLTGALA